MNQGAVSQVLSSIGLNGKEPHTGIESPPPAEIDAGPRSRQPPVECECVANPGSYPAEKNARMILGTIRKTRRLLTMKTRRDVYHNNLPMRRLVGPGAGYQRSAATYTRHALLLLPSAHQPAQHLAPLVPTTRPKQQLRWIRRRPSPSRDTMRCYRTSAKTCYEQLIGLARGPNWSNNQTID